MAESHLGIRLKPKWTKRRFWLDLGGAWVLLLGVILYSLMIGAEVVATWLPGGHLGEELELWLVTWPCIGGGACFVIGARRC